MRVGLDVGGTKTDAVAVDATGRVVGRMRRPTGWGPDAVVRTVLAAVADMRAETGAEVRSVGIGMPGVVEPGSTRVLHAVNLGVDDLDLGAVVEEALGVPVRVENDVKAAALGAAALHGTPGRAPGAGFAGAPGGATGAGRGGGAGGGATAYLNLGTGIAAGIVTDGLLWRGARGAAGEVGHISVDPAGPLCRCGQRGCIEALAGGAAVAERWGRPGVLPVRDVFDAADAGDARARGLRTGLAFGVAAAVRVLVLTADVGVVVLGGGLTGLGERLRADVAAELGASAASSAFLLSLRLPERVELLPAGSPAAALGAALVGAEHDPEEALTHG